MAGTTRRGSVYLATRSSSAARSRSAHGSHRRADGAAVTHQEGAVGVAVRPTRPTDRRGGDPVVPWALFVQVEPVEQSICPLLTRRVERDTPVNIPDPVAGCDGRERVEALTDSCSGVDRPAKLRADVFVLMQVERVERSVGGPVPPSWDLLSSTLAARVSPVRVPS